MKQMRDYRDCPSCNAKVGSACRRPDCPQLKPAINAAAVMGALLQEAKCPAVGCNNAGYIRDTSGEGNHMDCPWCATRKRALAGDAKP